MEKQLALKANNLYLMRMIMTKNSNNIRKVVYMARQSGKTTIAIRIAKKLNWTIIVPNMERKKFLLRQANVMAVVPSEVSLRGMRKAIIDDINELDPNYAKDICLDEFICFTSKIENNILMPTGHPEYINKEWIPHTLYQDGFLIKEIPGSGPTFIFQNLYPEKVYDQFNIKVSKDGDQWCALIGEDIQEGYSGFGDTIQVALRELIKEMMLKDVQNPEPDLFKCIKGMVEGINRSKYNR